MAKHFAISGLSNEPEVSSFRQETTLCLQNASAQRQIHNYCEEKTSTEKKINLIPLFLSRLLFFRPKVYYERKIILTVNTFFSSDMSFQAASAAKYGKKSFAQNVPPVTSTKPSQHCCTYCYFAHILKNMKAKSSSQIGPFFFTRCLPIELA